MFYGEKESDCQVVNEYNFKHKQKDYNRTNPYDNEFSNEIDYPTFTSRNRFNKTTQRDIDEISDMW